LYHHLFERIDISSLKKTFFDGIKISEVRKKGSEQIISRVLFHIPVARKTAMIIHLGQQLPAASSDATRER